jgi:hypothetical protein
MVLLEKTSKSLFSVYASGDKAVYADKAGSLMRKNIVEF